MSKKKIILLIVALLVFDQIVKIWIKTHFMLDQSVTVFPNWFFIRFIENPGAAFGFELGGNYGKLILSVFRLLAIGALGYYIFYLYRKKAPAGVLAGFSLIFAGALGNVLDSAFYGLLFSESTFTSVATFLPEGGGYYSPKVWAGHRPYSYSKPKKPFPPCSMRDALWPMLRTPSPPRWPRPSPESRCAKSPLRRACRNGMASTIWSPTPVRSAGRRRCVPEPSALPSSPCAARPSPVTFACFT